MKKRLLIAFIAIVFQNIAVSQTYDSIKLNGGKSLAIKRCYMCCGINVKHDSSTREVYKRFLETDSNYCITFISGYLMGDTIQKIIERIKIHVKYRYTDDYYDNSEMTITYKFNHGKLIEADDISPGASDTYLFKNDTLTGGHSAVDDLGYFELEADEALLYSKEDEKMILNSEVYIKRRQ